MSISDIRTSAKQGRLIVVFGAGASVALTHKSKSALNWTGLISSAMSFGLSRGLLNSSQNDRYTAALASNDIDDLLGAAEFVGRKLDAPSGSSYSRWMSDTVGNWTPDEGGMVNALRSLEGRGVMIATLNYDTLIETSTSLQSIDFSSKKQIFEWARGELSGVLHLHGVWTNPKECIFGIRDYHDTLNDDTRQMLQRSMSTMNRMLFVGCGDTFSDPNFENLIDWLRENISGDFPMHYALVRNQEVKERLSNPKWRDFVEPIGYGDNYTDLPAFLLDCFPTLTSPNTITEIQKIEAGKASHVIDSYRNYLVSDCGAMTIEGMRADLDTAQRKFDLEKLFVPLEVVRLPPESLSSPKSQAEKLRIWQEKNSKAIPFSKCFENEKRIALLALPGGGKTLLLKRLAVAYANKARRVACDDELPDLELLPLLIRCREWKEHIQKPIATMIKAIAEVSGNGNLKNLDVALEGPLQSGKVLLLIDGLDEIHDDADRSVFVDNLEKFIDTYPEIRVVVTSREAGFDLVAPSLSRFCKKYRIGPLSSEAVHDLCMHWHILMGGETPESIADANSISGQLADNVSLRLLAENPLLLTMLLVVKHGAGRLPPDRVSLYERAVEVLLDTWNIKGHEPLNVKEAVPQLACLAYELLRDGQQTATEKQILKIFSDAREKIASVSMYAKGNPFDFLKRVELRSSLLIQGGYTTESGSKVPFYQFRHLTFQEYLSAIAIVEGYTLSVDEDAELIDKFTPDVLADEWKEVVPMASVLARKLNISLIKELTERAIEEEQQFSKQLEEGEIGNGKLPPALQRIMQSLVEEALFPTGYVEQSLQRIAALGNATNGSESWEALCRGPFGDQLRHISLELLMSESGELLRKYQRNVALCEAYGRGREFWKNSDTIKIILGELHSTDTSVTLRAILSVGGAFWICRRDSSLGDSLEVYNRLEHFIFDDDPRINSAACWSWGFWRSIQERSEQVPPRLEEKTALRLLELFLNAKTETEKSLYSAPLTVLAGTGFAVFKSGISDDLRQKFDVTLEDCLTNQRFFTMEVVRLAFMFKGLATKATMKKLIKESEDFLLRSGDYDDIFKELKIVSLKPMAKSINPADKRAKSR